MAPIVQPSIPRSEGPTTPDPHPVLATVKVADTLYLRAHLGIGRTTLGFGHAASSRSGLSNHFAFAAGGGLLENFALYGKVFLTFTNYLRPVALERGAAFYGIGAGGVYTVPRIDLSCAGTLLVAKVDSIGETGAILGRTNPGAAIEFVLAKDWFWGRHFGAGVGVFLMLGAAKDRNAFQDSQSTVLIMSYGLAGSANYN